MQVLFLDYHLLQIFDICQTPPFRIIIKAPDLQSDIFLTFSFASRCHPTALSTCGRRPDFGIYPLAAPHTQLSSLDNWFGLAGGMIFFGAMGTKYLNNKSVFLSDSNSIFSPRHSTNYMWLYWPQKVFHKPKILFQNTKYAICHTKWSV